MKYRIILLFIVFVTPTSIMCQEAKPCMLNVDSVFSAHFESLNKAIMYDSINQFVPQSDRYFVQVISILSGIETAKESYTFHPLMCREKLIEYLIWYNENRLKIQCEILERGIYILKYDLNEKTIDELEKMRID